MHVCLCVQSANDIDLMAFVVCLIFVCLCFAFLKRQNYAPNHTNLTTQNLWGMWVQCETHLNYLNICTTTSSSSSKFWKIIYLFTKVLVMNLQAVSGDDLERNKRKLPDATFEAKNAVLGFVFGVRIALNVFCANIK